MNQELRIKNGERRGSVLIEALVAISVTSVGLVGIISLLTFSLRANAALTQEFIATYLAAEGIEVVKNVIDTTYVDIAAALSGGQTPPVWNERVAPGYFELQYDTTDLRNPTLALGSYSSKELIFDPVTGLYSYSVISPELSPTPFMRTVIIEFIDSIDCDTDRDDAARVLSVVRFTTAQGDEKEVTLEDHFFDWRDESETPTSRKPKACS